MNYKSLLQNKPVLIRGAIGVLFLIIIASSIFFSKAKTNSDETNEIAKITPTIKKQIVQETKKVNAKLLTYVTPTPKYVFIPSLTPTMTLAPTATHTPAPTNTPAPTATPTATPLPPDTEPPRTNIYHPQNGGEITGKLDGKICAILHPPSDNQSTYSDIGVSYKFDNDSWSDFKTSTAYLCKDSMPNGAHTLYVKSRDKAGNVEQEQVINFTLNIEGN